MLNSPTLLGRALALSILLHVEVIEVIMRLVTSAPQAARREPAALNVRLPDVREVMREAMRETPLPRAPLPRLMLPKEESQPNAIAARPVAPARRLPATPGTGSAAVPRDGAPRGLAGEAARSAYSQISRALLYPREAIEQGIEGEATVLLFLDGSGNAIAARLETSSGHALLDDAAVRAARTLRTLPDSAPREALLPVRFRLR